MTDLSELAKQLQEQVNVITKYIAKEKQPPPSFIPSGNDPMKTTIASLPPDIENAREKAHTLSWSINQLLTPPQTHLMWTGFQYYDPVCLRIILEKRIAFIIPVSSPGVPISEIAEKAGIPENRLIHVLRQLAATNIFREPSPRSFAHTSVSAVLTSPKFANTIDLMSHFVDEGYKCGGYLFEALDLYADKFDKVQKPELRTAFNLAFNTDQHYFDWIYNPENITRYGERFGRAMMSSRELIDSTLDTYDWTYFEKGDKIIDVGGGVGHVAACVARKVKPGVEIIVQDRPTVVEQGRTIHGHIVDLQPHDFFGEQPIKGAKMYYLRHILHDWPDSICRTILRNIVSAMTSESKLLVLDLVWKGDDYWSQGKGEEEMVQRWSQSKRIMNIRTLHMMNKLGAKERTEKEWEELFGSIGLKITGIYGHDKWQQIIETVKA